MTEPKAFFVIDKYKINDTHSLGLIKMGEANRKYLNLERAFHILLVMECSHTSSVSRKNG